MDAEAERGPGQGQTVREEGGQRPELFPAALTRPPWLASAGPAHDALPGPYDP